jgi:glycine/D-amino acid oxidase-like deaminating enzyme
MAATDPTIHGASWYATNSVEAPARGPLTLELDVDVCVIGGGLAGLTVALEVARRGWSVAVLEARRIAWNASGRNTGFVLPGFAADPQALIDKVGRHHAKTLWAWSEAGVEYVRRTARELKLPGVDLEENGWLQVSKTGDANANAQADLLNREFGVAAELWPAERVRGVLRSARYFSGVFFPKAFAVNPLNYALGLAVAAEAAGARIFEETPALEIDPAGVRKRITTPSARVRAGHVVLAGNVHIGGLMPELAGTLVPICAYAIVTAPIGDRLHDAIKFRGMVTDNELGDSDYRIVDRDRLLWADRCTVWQGEPRRYARSLLDNLRRTYPQLGEVEAQFAWSGALGNTVHRMPQIGELSPGVWLLSGFGGRGINTTAMGANIVAGAIVEGGQAWLLFRPFELVWAGGRLGRAAVQSYDWYFRTRERIEAWLAQRRQPVELPDIGTGPPAPQGAELDAASDEQPTKRRQRKRRKAKPSAEPNANSPVSAG